MMQMIIDICRKQPNIDLDSCRRKRELSGMFAQSWYLCGICFKNQKTPLSQCIFSTYKGSLANMTKHIQNGHASFAASIADESSASITSSQPPHKKARTLGQYFPAKQQMIEEARDSFQTSVYVYINDSGSAKRNVEKPIFRDMFHKAFEVFQAGGKPSDLVIGEHRINTIQDLKFNEMCQLIRNIVGTVRRWFLENSGSHRPFLSICHDIWDGKRRELLGISLLFIHPHTFDHFKLSAGLVHIKGKRAVEVAQETLRVLSRIGVTQADLYRPVNDTTNSALLAGRLIVGCDDSGTCGMHVVELILKHGTGQIIR